VCVCVWTDVRWWWTGHPRNASEEEHRFSQLPHVGLVYAYSLSLVVDCTPEKLSVSVSLSLSLSVSVALHLSLSLWTPETRACMHARERACMPAPLRLAWGKAKRPFRLFLVEKRHLLACPLCSPALYAPLCLACPLCTPSPCLPSMHPFALPLSDKRRGVRVGSALSSIVYKLKAPYTSSLRPHTPGAYGCNSYLLCSIVYSRVHTCMNAI
jgi:hypothetical protein